MRILFLGDIVGRGGRTIVADRLPNLRRRLALDVVIANGENAAHGRGLAPANAEALFEAGVDIITLGDHAFDERSIMVPLEKDRRILRPLNIAPQAPGRGSAVFELADNRRLLVINALGRVFMGWSYGDPFNSVSAVLDAHPLGNEGVHATVVDFHAEATSEKTAMGYMCDGRASLVAGTHTHIPTSDAHILPGGTAYVTDAGMCGSFDSVIGSKVAEPLSRFVTGLRKGRLEPATEAPTLCGVLAIVDDASGLATQVAPVRFGGVLADLVPEISK